MKRSRIAHGFALAVALSCWLAAAPVHAQKVKILVTASFAGDLQDLARRYPNLELVPFRSAQDILREISDAAAVVGLSGGHPTAKFLKAGKKLDWMATGSAGVEGILDDPLVRNADFILTNAKIIQGPEIADHAMALLLNHTRDLKHYNAQMKVGWQRQGRLPMIELRGKTMLIIGLGGIGTQVAERAFAFGMRVLAVDPKDIPFMRAVEYVGKPDQLDELLPEADVVVSCVPHTRKSQGMIGSRQFARMKDGVYVINISRGKIIDTEALTAALKSGKVRAAGLDVTDPEPLPSDHPLWSMPNVTITPHNATVSDHVRQRRLELFAENIERFMTGRSLRNVVNKKRGF